MSIDKRFHGELEATSKGAMLSARTSVKGSAGYLAIERVTGTLPEAKGRLGLTLGSKTGVVLRVD